MGELSKIAKNLGGLISRNSPHILTGLGCAGVLSTAVLAVKATPQALYILEEEERQRDRKRISPATNWEKVQLTWQCYIPATVVGVTSMACIIGANSIHTQRNAALASLYALSDTAFREYKAKVVEKIGAPRETEIRDEISKDRITNNPSNGDIIFTGTGSIKCYDPLSDRYFWSSYETIRQKVNDLNYRLRNEMRIPLNDFYYEINLKPTTLGDQMQFDIDKGQIDPHYSTQLSDDGVPCLVLNLDVYPVDFY